MKLLETKNSRLYGKLTHSYEDNEEFEAFLRMSRGFRNGGTVEPAVEACPARFKSRPLLPPCQGQGPHTGVLFGQNTLSDFEPWLKRRMLTATHTLIH